MVPVSHKPYANRHRIALVQSCCGPSPTYSLFERLPNPCTRRVSSLSISATVEHFHLPFLLMFQSSLEWILVYFSIEPCQVQSRIPPKLNALDLRSDKRECLEANIKYKHLSCLPTLSISSPRSNRLSLHSCFPRSDLQLVMELWSFSYLSLPIWLLTQQQ